MPLFDPDEAALPRQQAENDVARRPWQGEQTAGQLAGKQAAKQHSAEKLDCIEHGPVREILKAPIADALNRSRQVQAHAR